MVRTIVFQREDGTEVLVTIWADGHATMAERQAPAHVWGPPVQSIVDYKTES